ncbi:MAG: GNAT family N-acetyltransferase [Lapillicoccus sp.]
MVAAGRPDAYLAALVDRAQDILGENLVGAYAAGSLALDAYQPGRSDIDVALVTAEPLTDPEKRGLVAALRHEALRVPARGLELVAYTRAAAGSGTTEPAFEVELNTGPGMPFRATYRPEDRPLADGLFWYALDRSILSDSDRSLSGPPASAVFADVAPAALRDLLVDALTWWLRQQGDLVDAVLGACRSLVRFRDGEWLPKVAAGQRLPDTGFQPAAVVQAAVAARLGTGAPPSGPAARAVPRAVRAEIRGTRLRPLTAADLPALIPLQETGGIAGLGHIFPQEAHPFPRERIAARWREEIVAHDTDTLAVEVNGELRGFVALRGEEVLHFGTAVESWGSGLAEEAHDLAVDRLVRRGVGTARLWVFTENTRAVRFYERLGWQPTGETRPTTFPPHPTLVAYQLDLRPADPSA